VPYRGTAKTYPHGVVRLESGIRALTTDPAFAGGRCTSPPKAGLAAWSVHWAAWVWSQEWFGRDVREHRVH
jgi:homoserine O-acetyltransferase